MLLWRGKERAENTRWPIQLFNGKRMLRRLVVSWLTVLPIAGCTSSTGPGPETWYIPIERIQEALDAADDGDVISVGPGFYGGDLAGRPLDFEGKNLTLQSVMGPEATVINAGRHWGITFRSGETRAAVLDGFTIVNGQSPSVFRPLGGGIAISESSPTIRNCVISGCRALGGGGVSCYASSARFENCTIVANRAEPGIPAGSGGGGLHLVDSDVELFRSLVWGNCAQGNADGIYVDSLSSVALIECAVDAAAIEGDGTVAYESCFTGDPRFCALESCDEAPSSFASYRLWQNSPCFPENNVCRVRIGAVESRCGWAGGRAHE